MSHAKEAYVCRHSHCTFSCSSRRRAIYHTRATECFFLVLLFVGSECSGSLGQKLISGRGVGPLRSRCARGRETLCHASWAASAARQSRSFSAARPHHKKKTQGRSFSVKYPHSPSRSWGERKQRLQNYSRENCSSRGAAPPRRRAAQGSQAVSRNRPHQKGSGARESERVGRRPT